MSHYIGNADGCKQVRLNTEVVPLGPHRYDREVVKLLVKADGNSFIVTFTAKQWDWLVDDVERRRDLAEEAQPMPMPLTKRLGTDGRL